MADNVGEVFGAAKYLDYVRGCGRYDSQHRPATIEYSTIPDAVEISVYRGDPDPRRGAVSRGGASA